MHTDDELKAIRAAYAHKMTARMPDTAVEAAYASVPREDFLGAGPWPIFAGMGRYIPTKDADPAHLYADILIGIDTERGLNNGQPSWHAFLLAHAKPTAGEHIVHIGTGSGYYTALMAELVGPLGRVTGIEFDADLASRTKSNLTRYSNTRSSREMAPPRPSTPQTSSTSMQAPHDRPTHGSTGWPMADACWCRSRLRKASRYRETATQPPGVRSL